ncbi:hypothetical protein ACFW04_011263 [Cataglyphis niger]
MITAFIEQYHRDWDLHLAEFRFAYNSAYHTSLQATPAFLNLGREPSARARALRDWVVENLEATHQRQSRYYNLRRRDVRFVVGDRVWKRQHVLSSAAHAISAKLATKYHGPFTISRILSPVVYELADAENKVIGKTHVKDLKPYIASNP